MRTMTMQACNRPPAFFKDAREQTNESTILGKQRFCGTALVPGVFQHAATVRDRHGRSIDVMK